MELAPGVEILRRRSLLFIDSEASQRQQHHIHRPTPHFHPPSLTPSTQPSQTNMDHSHMSHGDMDMGGSDSQCQMNVRPPYSPSLPIHLPSRPPSPDLHQPPTDLSPPTDALHLLHPQPLHHFPLLAHNHHPLPPPLPPRHHPPHRWLRARPRRESEIRSPQR